MTPRAIDDLRHDVHSRNFHPVEHLALNSGGTRVSGVYRGVHPNGNCAKTLSVVERTIPQILPFFPSLPARVCANLAGGHAVLPPVFQIPGLCNAYGVASCMATYRLVSRARLKSPDTNVSTPTKLSFESLAVSPNCYGRSKQPPRLPLSRAQRHGRQSGGCPANLNRRTASSKRPCTRYSADQNRSAA